MTVTLGQAEERGGKVIGKAVANGYIDIAQWSGVPAPDVHRIYHGISINPSNMETGCVCLLDLDHLSQEPPGCWDMACCRVTVTTLASRPIRAKLF